MNNYFGTSSRTNGSQENPEVVGLTVFPSQTFKDRLFHYQEMLALKNIGRACNRLEILQFEQSLNEERRLQKSIYTRAAAIIVKRTLEGMNHVN